MKKYLGEFFGTFGIVFIGTAALIINQQTDGSLSIIGIAIAFGVAVAAMIIAFADMSGGHFNPAVTIGFAIVKKFHFKDVIPYITCQVSGALAASFILKLIFPDVLDYGTTNPSGTQLQSFIAEIILMYILVISIMLFSKIFKAKLFLAALGIGSVIFLEVIFGGPISGASMNPARSIGPAVASMNFENLWIYISAPILGAAAAMLTWKVVVD